MADKVPNIPQKPSVIGAVSQQRTTAETQSPPAESATFTPPAPRKVVDKVEVKTARSLYEHLVETGSPVTSFNGILQWLNDNPGANATNLYEWLNKHPKVTWGTKNKAIKFALGPEFSPENTDPQAPLEELERLRGENEQLKSQLAQKNAQCLFYQRQRDETASRNTELIRQLTVLKGHRTSAELEAMGFVEENDLVGAGR